MVSFYNMFFDAPQPRHHVHVCTNLPCSLRGARALLHELEEHLGVDERATPPTAASTSATRSVWARAPTPR